MSDDMSMFREVKVCLLGDVEVGKTSLVGRFVNNVFDPSVTTTVGASFVSKALMVDDQDIKFQIWDTAGQERYRSLLPMYYRNAAAAIIVYDITREETFKAVQNWIAELHNLTTQKIVLAIAGNKCDLEDKRKIPYSRGEECARQVNAIFVETSALDATNVEEVFYQIGRKLPPASNAHFPSGQSLLRTPRKGNSKKCSSCGNG